YAGAALLLVKGGLSVDIDRSAAADRGAVVLRCPRDAKRFEIHTFHRLSPSSSFSWSLSGGPAYRPDRRRAQPPTRHATRSPHRTAERRSARWSEARILQFRPARPPSATQRD